MEKIISKMDAKRIIDGLKEHEQIKLYPNGIYGEYNVIITNFGWAEFGSTEIGIIPDRPMEEIVNKLYEYRRTYNEVVQRSYMRKS